MPRRNVPSVFGSKIGARIHELRLQKDMSLADLADAGFISKGHLSTIEQGRCAITVETLERIAKGLDLPPMYLLMVGDGDDRERIADGLRHLPQKEAKKLRIELHARFGWTKAQR
jgi:transcriptional regulator with XRE-family HTH domain